MNWKANLCYTSIPDAIYECYASVAFIASRKFQGRIPSQTEMAGLDASMLKRVLKFRASSSRKMHVYENVAVCTFRIATVKLHVLQCQLT